LEATIQELKAALQEVQQKEPQHQEETFPEKSQLEATIQELKAALQEVQQKEPQHQEETFPEKSQLEATIQELKVALQEVQHKEVQHQEETFTELKHALEEAHRKEGALQQQITDLQSELQHQIKFVHKLQTELDKVEQLKSDFDQAKKAALLLAEANEKLMQENNSLKKSQEKQKEPEKISLKKEVKLEPLPKRPIQKESEKPADFASKSWLL
jgi:predicted nucleic acid-binding protein